MGLAGGVCKGLHALAGLGLWTDLWNRKASHLAHRNVREPRHLKQSSKQLQVLCCVSVYSQRGANVSLHI